MKRVLLDPLSDFDESAMRFLKDRVGRRSRNERRTTIIGFFGGPGIGKSTAAWTAAAWLKCHGASVELANEFAKRWAWQGREITPLDELVILGQQIAEEADLIGKVDYIVTEKPVLLGLAYTRLYQPDRIVRAVEATITAHYAHIISLGHRHVNVLFQRTGDYDIHGRFENREQAELVDYVAQQTLGELSCFGHFDSKAMYSQWQDVYPVYYADRNQIPEFLNSFFNMKETQMNVRAKRPGSFGAFLLAAYKFGTEESIQAEVKRAQGAGTASTAIGAVLGRLSTTGYWLRDVEGIKLSNKGLRFLRKHGLIS